MITAYFVVFALITLLCGCGVLISRHPINGAVNLIGVMLGLSGVYALLAAPFLAVVQILVYAGAIMMLVVFVIMILNGAKQTNRLPFGNLSRVALLVPLLLAAIAVTAMVKVGPVLQDSAVAMAQEGSAPVGEPGEIARVMFDQDADGYGYFLLFEIVGLLLLVAVVGAVMLSKRDLASIADASPDQAVTEGAHHA